MFKSFYENIWKDPVFSTVIAAGIIALIGLGGGFAFWSQIKDCYCYLTSDPWRIAAVILGLFIVILFFYLSLLRKKVKPSRQNEKPQTPLEWLNNQKQDDYWFLFWFPANHTRATRTYRNSQSWDAVQRGSFDQIPEVYRLLQKRVLIREHVDLLHHRIVIDDEVLQHLEQVIQNEVPAEKREEKFQFLRKDFRDLFFGRGR